MVDDEDVRVPVTPGGVRVHRDHVVSAMHAFGKFDGHVPDALKVSLRGYVELIRVECQNIALKLILPTMSGGVCLGARYELRRSCPTIDHRHRIRGSTSRSALD